MANKTIRPAGIALAVAFGLGLVGWIVLSGGSQPQSSSVAGETRAGSDQRAEAQLGSDTDLRAVGRTPDATPPPGQAGESDQTELSANSATISVVDATSGLPIPDLRLDFDLRALDENGALQPSSTLARSTDAEGRCQIPIAALGTYGTVSSSQIKARDGEIQPSEFVLRRSETELQLTVDLPSGMIALECRDISGSTVAGAQLWLHQASGAIPGRLVDATTNDYGLAFLDAERVPTTSGTWSVQARHPNHGASTLEPLTAVPDGPPQIIQLAISSELTVRVLDQNQQPVQFQRAQLRSLAQTEQLHVSQLQASPRYLNRNGECTWQQLAPGPYRLSVASPVSRQRFEFDVEVESAIEHLDFAVTLRPLPVALAGRVLQPDGSPAVHHYLEAYDAEGELLAGTRTNANGEFRLFGETPHATVTVSPQALADRALNFEGAPFEFPTGKQDVVLIGRLREQQHVAVMVRSATTGLPLADALVSLLPDETGMEQRLGRTNEAGVCRVLLDGERGQSLGASAAAHQSVAVTWQPGDDYLEVELPALSQVSLRIVDAYFGTPIAGADLLDPTTLRLIGQSSATGDITLELDPELRFFVRARGYVDSVPLDMSYELTQPSRSFGPRLIGLQAEAKAESGLDDD